MRLGTNKHWFPLFIAYRSHVRLGTKNHWFPICISQRSHMGLGTKTPLNCCERDAHPQSPLLVLISVGFWNRAQKALLVLGSPVLHPMHTPPDAENPGGPPCSSQCSKIQQRGSDPMGSLLSHFNPHGKSTGSAGARINPNVGRVGKPSWVTERLLQEAVPDPLPAAEPEWDGI